MHVSELWRYRVKSLKGEPLHEVEIGADGLAGDRLVHVRGGGGRVITSRTKPQLRIGEALIAVARLRPRCVMTTYDPDTQEQDQSVLRRIVSEFGGAVALDCTVITPGRIRVGDPLELLRSAAAQPLLRDARHN